ncbi:Hypothetical protein BCD_1338 (plasmid) [Borrelia crocidurae DOU]|uniref:Lipoprotein n=1 Tax=Borrelia crocidurae DOU TaxID=1293575 RepID=W5SJV6_9SPIR|nr:hypothetical protein [Borrelia crocidurae]AHH07404.1 Hypothetical protein BCD_1338 [Borrelia crocidurae DOU]
MKKIYVVIFILMLLVFGCKIGERGIAGFVGHNGKDGLGGHDGRSDVELLKVNYLKFKRMFHSNYESFKLKKEDFDKEIPFDNIIFDNEFKTESQRNSIYASLDYNVEDIEILKNLIARLFDFIDDDRKENIKALLFSLRDIDQYVSAVITASDVVISDFNLVNIKKGDNIDIVSSLNAMFSELSYRRASVIKDIRNIFSSIKKFMEVASADRISSINGNIRIIGSNTGMIYKKIHVGDESLLGLKNDIIKKLEELKKTLWLQ